MHFTKRLRQKRLLCGADVAIQLLEGNWLGSVKALAEAK